MLIFAGGCNHPPAPPVRPAVEAAHNVLPPVFGPFVGSEACRECHPSEFAAHSATAHAATLHLVTAGSLPTDPPAGRIPGTELTITRSGNGSAISADSLTGSPAPLHLAFGSGKTGLTYVSLVGGGGLIEVHKSYFPRMKVWYTTPGHKDHTTGSVGEINTPQQAAACILCHAIKADQRADRIDPRFLGVGCESCHGPGDRHIEAMRKGKTGDIGMERLGAIPAEQLIVICGRCHRNLTDVRPPGVRRSPADVAKDLTLTNRFQPFGLMISRCYKESGGKLSCITCHDPHSDASRDASHYEAICRSCHGGQSSGAAALGRGKKCPVNPESGCVSCHMPSRPVFDKGGLDVRMADHRIAVHRKNDAPQAAPVTH